MITASQALAAAKKKQIDIIENSINSSVELGQYQVNVLNSLSDENKELLIKAGYKLSSKLTMIGNEVTISWDSIKPVLKKTKKK